MYNVLSGYHLVIRLKKHEMITKDALFDHHPCESLEHFDLLLQLLAKMRKRKRTTKRKDDLRLKKAMFW